MKKFFAFVVAMAMTVVANAGFYDSLTRVDNADGSVDIIVMDDVANAAGFYLVIDAEGMGASIKSGDMSADWGGIGGWGSVDADTGAELVSGTVFALGNSTAWNLTANTVVLSFTYSGRDATAYYMDENAATAYKIVPEPMTMALLGLGGLVAARRRNA